ncbi:diguanylate cyclase [Massilia sp. PWRC2]|uniref:diguanylate cyclase n=1 Tax=Massilia sp. PWRC2 TaxID=2804626 RepID=UPI003CF74431
MFALDEEVARWHAELARQPLDERRCELLLQLNWHLRQRDPPQAQAIAASAAALIEALPAPARALAQARCLLVEAERLWLFGQLDRAHQQAGAALARCAECAGASEHAVQPQASAAHACRADGHWLLAWISVDRGETAASDGHFAAAAGAAVAAADPVRRDICDAAAALADVFRDLHAAEARWGGRFADADGGGSRSLAARGWIDDLAGTTAFQASDFGRAIGLMIAAYDIAMMTGQVRRAVNLATNIGNTFTSLNAHHAALEWMQRGLDLARPTGWPLSIGLGLMQTAETLRQLGQRDAARALLDEALATMAPLADSRAYAVALEYLGDVALDSGDHAGALANFKRLEQRGAALGQADFESGALRGQAHALSHLQRPVDALARADAALTLAREHSDTSAEIAALKVLADIHSRHRLAAPAPMQAATPALHYLLQAQALAATIDGYIVPGGTLDAMGREYAKVGNFARAYEVALESVAAREQINSHEATNRAIAMQVQFQTERAHTEGEHHRQLAAAEARRAEVQQQISATLEHLSAIGQEITTHLDADAVFRALDRHVHGLLDATHFAVFLLDADGAALRCAFGVEAGRVLPATRVLLSDPNAISARCVRERREIVIEAAADAPAPGLIPGTIKPRSVMFAPLQVGERVLGAMTVQSMQAAAYGERERLIFRTLCAYGAIALDNARAYRQVAATQAELLEKNLELEKAYQALEEVSLTDQLTGLRNRRFFLQHVDTDVRLSLRSYDDAGRRAAGAARADAHDLVFFMVDLDHFKDVNDRFGHAAGDAVLVQMQERLREVFRESDYLVRWGGEEFLVLARATRRDEARAVAERIRRAVADRPFVLPDGAAIDKTCSIGFACFPFVPAAPRLLSWSEVVELADQALYLAKHGGRNAWAALYSSASGRQQGLFAHLMHDLAGALRHGEVTLLSSKDIAAADSHSAATATKNA